MSEESSVGVLPGIRTEPSRHCPKTAVCTRFGSELPGGEEMRYSDGIWAKYCGSSRVRRQERRNRHIIHDFRTACLFILQSFFALGRAGSPDAPICFSMAVKTVMITNRIFALDCKRIGLL